MITSITISKNRIVFSSAKPRKKARDGDIKFVRGKRFVRRQRMSEGCYCVRRGKPLYEWVQENE